MNESVPIEIRQAPGCFGAASVYSVDSNYCNACVAFVECGKASLTTLEKIKGIIDVSDLLARHAKAREASKRTTVSHSTPLKVNGVLPVHQPKPITEPVVRKTTKAKVTFEINETDNEIIAILGKKSVKACQQAIRLCNANRINECKTMLPKGINPFAETGPGFIRILVDLLLSGGVTYATYKARLMQELGWTEGSAASNVAIGFAVFHAFGLLGMKDNKLVVNPALAVENT